MTQTGAARSRDNHFERFELSILDNKLFRYSLTAGGAAVVDVGGFALLCLMAIPVAVSAVTSFCLAAIVNYLLSSRFAFHASPTLRGFGLFFVAAIGGLTVNVLVTFIGSVYVGIAPVLAKVVGVGAAFLLNFWVNLRIVFRTRRSERVDMPSRRT